MEFKNKLPIHLMKNISGYYWYIVDNLAFKLDKLAERYYKKSIGAEYKREYQTFGISKNDKVLHIGSGAFPLTEITLAETIGATVVGIDSSMKAVNSADDIVHKKNLQSKIKINYGNGINYPINDFDVVIVSSCASPMVKIIEHILKNATNNSKIIVREIDTSIKPLVRYINMQRNVSLVKKIDHNPFPFIKPFGWQSFHLIKKE
jgi:2-polyprenyl-3-methyl-5-hydroxy-6-metoxy-1,4-benzoquinol methylase